MKHLIDYIKGIFFLIWDPDYVKLTPSERRSLEEAMADEELIPMEEIDWGLDEAE